MADYESLRTPKCSKDLPSLTPHLFPSNRKLGDDVQGEICMQTALLLIILLIRGATSYTGSFRFSSSLFTP